MQVCTRVYGRLKVGRKCTTLVPPPMGSEVMAESDGASGAGCHSPRHKRLQEPCLRGRTNWFYFRGGLPKTLQQSLWVAMSTSRGLRAAVR